MGAHACACLLAETSDQPPGSTPQQPSVFHLPCMFVVDVCGTVPLIGLELD